MLHEDACALLDSLTSYYAKKNKGLVPLLRFAISDFGHLPYRKYGLATVVLRFSNVYQVTRRTLWNNFVPATQVALDPRR